MFSALSFGILFSVISSSLAAIYDDPSQIPRHRSYDFIVVGAGTAGNVVAARLSENRNTSVLVIEAGRRYVDLVLRKPDLILDAATLGMIPT